MALRGGPSYAYLCDQLETVGTNHSWVDRMTSASGWDAGAYSTTPGFGSLAITATDTLADPLKIYDADFSLRRYTHIRMWIGDVSKLATLNLRTYNAAGTQLTSHNILTGAQKVAVSGWNDLVVAMNPHPLENVRRLRFNVQATAGQTTDVYVGAIQTCDLRALCTIWTDDGHGSVYTEAYPLLAARGMAAAVSVHSSKANTAGYMTTANLQTLDGAGWDILNHSDDNIDATTLTESEFRTSLDTCLAFLRDTVGIKQARHLFVHPQGSADANTRALLADYAWMDRSRTSDNSRIPVEWISIGGDSVNNTTSVATVQGWIDNAIADQEWLVLIFHKFTASAPPASLEYNNDDFDDILAYLESAAIDVVTPTGAVARMAPNYALTGDDTVAVLDRATAYWKGVDYSGSGDWLDGSGNGHDATPRNSPTFSGGVWTLNGTTQDFSISHHADLNIGSGSFTLVVRGNVDSRAFQCAFSKRANGATASAGYLCYMAPDRMRVEVSDGVTEDGEYNPLDWDTGSAPFTTTSTWAFARDGGVEYKVARNASYAPSTADGAGDADNALGAYIGSLGGSAYFWGGEIEAVALFVGEVVSESDLDTLATELTTPAATGGGTPSGVAGNYGVNIAVRVGV